MAYVYVVTVGLEEFSRTATIREAAGALVAECERLVEIHSGSIYESSWIEGFLVDEADVPSVLDDKRSLRKYPRAGISFFKYVINDAHQNGWMQNGEWIHPVAKST